MMNERIMAKHRGLQSMIDDMDEEESSKIPGLKIKIETISPMDEETEERDYQDVEDESKEMEMGEDVEKEHLDTIMQDGNPEEMVKNIAEDHLQEDPNYYSKLDIIENGIQGGEDPFEEIIRRKKLEKMKRG